MVKALKSFLAIGLVLFFAVFFAAQARAEVAAPTLVAPNEKTATADLRPVIIGLVKSGSLAKIFIDGRFDGQTGILKNDSGTANFAYKPAASLSRGTHQVYSVAEDVSGELSPKSNVLNFKIELPMPAPTLFKPVVNKSSSLSRPFIVGLAKNNSKIKVYIDKKYQGEFTVKNNVSGTANFAFRPTQPLARGNHLVYAVAMDRRGKTSIWSNVVGFLTKHAAIAQSAEEQKTGAVAKIEEPKPAVKTQAPAPVISRSTGAVEENKSASEKNNQALGETTENPGKTVKENVADKLSQQTQAEFDKIKNLIATTTAKNAKTGQGMIDESRGNQSKLKLSMILFVLFLLGVVGWLLWVNRELVKERQAQNRPEEPDKQDKLL